MEKVLETYVPRHIRLGLSIEPKNQRPGVHELVEEIPVVDENGSVVYTESVKRLIDADEDMQQYKLSAFDLSALIKAGVPLKAVNLTKSRTASIDQLLAVCQSVDGAEKLVQRYEEQRKERELWLQPAVENVNETELNEIY